MNLKEYENELLEKARKYEHRSLEMKEIGDLAAYKSFKEMAESYLDEAIALKLHPTIIPHRNIK